MALLPSAPNLASTAQSTPSQRSGQTFRSADPPGCWLSRSEARERHAPPAFCKLSCCDRHIDPQTSTQKDIPSCRQNMSRTLASPATPKFAILFSQPLVSFFAVVLLFSSPNCSLDLASNEATLYTGSSLVVDREVSRQQTHLTLVLAD